MLSTSLAPSNAILAYQNSPATQVVESASTTATPADLSSTADASTSNNVSNLDVSLETTNATSSPGDPINVKEYVKQYFADTPLLAKIAGCESQFRQFNKNGDVLRGIIVHQDVGVMQINETYQGALASALGYNIYTLQGNVAYARWLYNHEGAQPWVSSSGCWAN